MRILVVDDIRDQLETICRGLFLYEHRCFTALNSTEAEHWLTGPDGDSIDIVVTDITADGNSVLSLIETVKQVRPELPIVVITGLQANMEVQAVYEMGLPVLQKPFDPQKLNNLIQKYTKKDDE